MSPGDGETFAENIRPVVAGQPGNRGLWAFMAFAIVLAIALFQALEARRAKVESSLLEPVAGGDTQAISAPPPLALPYDQTDAPRYVNFPGRALGAAPIPAGNAGASPIASPAHMTASDSRGSSRLPAPNAAAQAFPQAGSVPAPAFAYQALPSPPALPSKPDGRVEASMLRNPALTVPQGTIIHAVLETALDSTRAGFARAIVSRDVTSFDGSRVLVPRGSKLFGEYQSDLNLGQKRALVQWHRLTRPDGAIIDVDSPSSDPLGRAGIRGKVHSHFFERFGGAILQSVLDVGVNLATRKATGDNVIVALPGSATGVTVQKPEDIRPTLQVRAGSSVAVFVARDLDFSPVEP